MSTWTLEYSGTTQTFDAWGLVGLRRELVSLGVDRVSFRHDAAAVDSAALFPYDAEIVIYKDGVRWFAGRIDSTPRSGSPADEGLSYVVVGPWWYLDNLVYQQDWNVWKTSVLATEYKSHVMLGIDLTGDRKNNGEVIQGAVQWCIDSVGAKLQLSTTNLPAVEIPVDEAQDLTCAEVIRRMVRWSPDVVTWFDYTTSPPTLHIERRATLSTVNLAMVGDQVESLGIRSRDDLQLSAVALKYERTDTVDGVPYFVISKDIWPTAAMDPASLDLYPAYRLGALMATINLAGGSVTNVRGSLVCDTINAAHSDSATRLAWWKAKHPWLNDTRIYNLTITYDSTNSTWTQGTYPRELVAGQIADWMLSGSSPLAVQDAVLKAKATFSLSPTAPLANVVVNEIKEKEINVRVRATNATTGDYSAVASVVSPEPVPSGVAQAIYEGLSVLQWEGQIRLVQDECNASATVRHLVNVTGGLSSWATMAAMIYSVDEDVDSGITTLSFGPNPQLGLNDFITLLRLNRGRFIYTNPAAVQTGRTGAAGDVQLGEYTDRENSIPGEDYKSRLELFYDTSNKIRLQTSSGMAELAGYNAIGSDNRTFALSSLGLSTSLGGSGLGSSFSASGLTINAPSASPDSGSITARLQSGAHYNWITITIGTNSYEVLGRFLG